MTHDAKAIVDLIRSEIMKVGWSETARRSGVNRSTLWRTFRWGADRVPSFYILAQVACTLGVRLEAHRG